MITNLLNPKAVIFYVAVLAALLDRAQPAQHQALELPGIHVLVATVVHVAIVAPAGTLRPVLTNAGLMGVAGQVLDVPLAGVGLWIAFARLSLTRRRGPSS